MVPLPPIEMRSCIIEIQGMSPRGLTIIPNSFFCVPNSPASISLVLTFGPANQSNGLQAFSKSKPERRILFCPRWDQGVVHNKPGWTTVSWFGCF